MVATRTYMTNLIWMLSRAFSAEETGTVTSYEPVSIPKSTQVATSSTPSVSPCRQSRWLVLHSLGSIRLNVPKWTHSAWRVASGMLRLVAFYLSMIAGSPQLKRMDRVSGIQKYQSRSLIRQRTEVESWSCRHRILEFFITCEYTC